MLQTLVRLGRTGHAEQTLTELGEDERASAQVRIAVAAQRLACDDPQAAADALAPVLDGSVREVRQLAEQLTDSETRVLRYLPTHLTVQEIADELFVSVNTVSTHKNRLYTKLGVHSRHEAVDRARALGLLAPSTRRA